MPRLLAITLFVGLCLAAPPTHADWTFVRGDVNNDAAVEISDAVSILSYLFVPGTDSPLCFDAADVNDDGEVQISDAVFALSYLFVIGSPAPFPPFPSCGEDPTADALDCAGPLDACPAPSGPPTITSVAPLDAIEAELYTYDVEATDPNPFDTLTYALIEGPVGANIDTTSGVISWTPGASQTGPHSFTVEAIDSEDPPLSDSQSFVVTVIDVDQPPVFTSIPPQYGTETAPFYYRARAIDPDSVGVITFELTVAPAGATIDPETGALTWTPTTDQVGTQSFTVTATLGTGESTQQFDVDVAAADEIPPDPASIANEIDPTVATTLLDNVRFLFESDPPVQRGVDPEIFERHRAAAIRGRVTERDGGVLAGVLVTVHGRPEFGSTVTQPTGEFDLVVNGGDEFTLSFRKSGYATAQRKFEARWNGFDFTEQVTLVPLDANVTAVDLSATTMQVAQGTPQLDADGERCATLLFPAGTSASLRLADGSTQPLTTLSVRATEYTVGDEGPAAMPAPLPYHTAYTYCVELSVDEAEAAGATGVEFDQTVPVYLENFLGFPTGTVVPSGYYDREDARWVRQESGLVIEILTEAGGTVTVDLDGDGLADTGSALDDLGITSDELSTLASLYEEGQTLWRMPTEHFSPHDYNFPYQCDGCDPPVGGVEDPPRRGNDDPCKAKGYSTLYVQNQTLGEVIPIRGTPYSLHYRSDQVRGRLDDYTLRIPLSTSPLGAPGTGTWLGTRVDISIAGRDFISEYTPAEAGALGYELSFTWDGLDAYGRRAQGVQRARVSVGYVYEAIYITALQWSVPPPPVSSTLAPGRFGVTKWQSEYVDLGNLDAGTRDLGGWTLDAHHVYDPEHQRLYLGSGESYGSDSLGREIELARYQYSDVLDIGADGSLYFTTSHQLRRLYPDGSEVAVAGSPGSGFSGDGGPATDALFDNIQDVDVLPDGSILVADGGNGRIRRIDPEGIVDTVAGTGATISGDGGLALDAGVQPLRVIADSLGGYYIMSVGRVRYVDPDGTIDTLIGGGGTQYYCDEVHATTIYPGGGGFNDMELSPEGEVHVLVNDQCLARLTPEGMLEPVAGGDCPFPYSCDTPTVGEAALGRRLNAIGLSFDLDGSVLLACNSSGTQEIRRITPDGFIDILAGTSVPGCPGLDPALGPALDAQIAPTGHIQLGPDGAIYFGHSACGGGTMRLQPVLPGFTNGDQLIPARDGSAIYHFDRDGRHLETLHALTGNPILTFEHDDEGRLLQVIDRSGNVTELFRDVDGRPTSIVGPFGHVTALTLDADSLLAQTVGPGGESHGCTYVDDGGLLASHTDPAGQTSTFGYDAMGRLLTDTSSTGDTITLAREEFFSATGFSITQTYPSGREIIYTHVRSPEGTWTHSIINGGCCTSVETFREWSPSKRTITKPDGTVITRWKTADPRWKLLAPLSGIRVMTPGGVDTTVYESGSVQLDNPDDPLSLITLTYDRHLNSTVSTSVYDAATQTVTSTTAEGRVASLVFDEVGRPIESTVGGFAPTVFTYDEFGRAVEISQLGGAETRSQSLAYDPLGRLTSTSDFEGLVTTFVHDEEDRLVAMAEAVGTGGERTTAVAYDATGRPIGITLPNGVTHGYAWTPSSQLAAVDHPDVGSGVESTAYVYDDDRGLERIDRPGGIAVNIDRDAEGRITEWAMPSGTISYSRGLGNGQLTSIQGTDGETLDFAYDGNLLIDRTWSGLGTTTQLFDNDGQVIERQVNGIGVPYAYDADGLLIGAGELSIERDPATGIVIASTLSNITEALVFDDFAQLHDRQVTGPGGLLFSESMVRDLAGRIVERTETVDSIARVVEYDYDVLGRLVEVSVDGAVVETYEYDILGQRTSATIGGATLAATYDDRGRLLSLGASEYAYDSVGARSIRTDTATGDVTLTSYDVRGALLAVELPAGTLIEYALDGLGRRMGKSVNGARVQSFLYRDRLNPMAELDEAGVVTHRFVYGAHPYTPAYMMRDATIYRMITDDLGSVRLVVDADTGAVAQRLDYDACGRVLIDTAPGFQPFGFAGGLYDPDTGLVRFGARDYDPDAANWTSRDPKGLAGGPGLYAYCNGDPVNFIDPWGLEPENEDFSFRKLLKDSATGAAEGAVEGDPVTGAVQGAVGYLAGELFDEVADAFLHPPRQNFGPPRPINAPDEDTQWPDPDDSNVFDPGPHTPTPRPDPALDPPGGPGPSTDPTPDPRGDPRDRQPLPFDPPVPDCGQ